MIRSALAALLLIAAAPAVALADAPVATSDATAPAAPATDAPMAGAKGPDAPTLIDPSSSAARDPAPRGEPLADRRVHGEVGVAVGSGGYRSGYVSVTGPIGESGWGGVAISQTQSGRGRGGYFGGGPGGYDGPYRLAGPLAGSSCVTVHREDGLGDPTLAPAGPGAAADRCDPVTAGR